MTWLCVWYRLNFDTKQLFLLGKFRVHILWVLAPFQNAKVRKYRDQMPKMATTVKAFSRLSCDICIEWTVTEAKVYLLSLKSYCNELFGKKVLVKPSCQVRTIICWKMWLRLPIVGAVKKCATPFTISNGDSILSSWQCAGEDIKS